MAGYSRLIGAQKEGMRERLTAHRRELPTVLPQTKLFAEGSKQSQTEASRHLHPAKVGMDAAPIQGGKP